jgi:hypothetical protein
MLSSWWLLDRSPVCGPDLEWDRCPSHLARVVQLSAWLAMTGILVIATRYAQKIVENSWENFVHRKSRLNIVEKSKDL